MIAEVQGNVWLGIWKKDLEVLDAAATGTVSPAIQGINQEQGETSNVGSLNIWPPSFNFNIQLLACIKA